MKRLTLFTSLLFLLTGAARAATVSGTVTIASTSAALSGQKVYIADSFSSATLAYLDSTITNTSGGYSFTVPSSVSSGSLRVFTYACGYISNSIYYSGTSATVNLSVCATSTAYISQTLKTSSSSAPVYGQKVYLLDFTASPNLLDSAYTNASGTVAFLIPTSVLSDSFKIYTSACGIQSQKVYYNGRSITAPTMYICIANPVVSGTVTNTFTSGVVAGQKVVLIDSSTTALLFADSMNTNTSGQYSFAVPLTVTSGTMIVAMRACGQRFKSSSAFSGSSLTINLAVCATSTATVSGTITNITSSAAVAGWKVYLSDTTSGGTVLLDSAITNSAGFYTITIPPSIMNGAALLVKTISCGSLQSPFSYYYTGLSFTVNRSVYTTTPTATLSGTVYTHAGALAPGVTVRADLIVNGYTTSSAYGTTSSTGTYSIAVPCSWTSGHPVNFYTYSSSCSFTFNGSTLFTGSSITRVDSTCYPHTYNFSGTVYKQGSGVAANARVYLIALKRDTLLAVTTLTALDSTLTNASGHYYIGTNTGLSPYGSNTYAFIKAALLPTDPSYTSFLPTYHDSALNWNLADTELFHGAYANSYVATGDDVSLRAGTNPGGPAFIGGDVLLGANKSTNVGDPLAKRILILTTAADVPVAYTYSDVAGKFSFPNIAYGTYKLFGDAGGKTNPPLTITLSPTNSTVSSVVFEENSTSFKGHVNPLGVNGGGNKPNAALSIYPNPAHDFVAIGGLQSSSGTATVTLRGVTGIVISKTFISPGSTPRIATAKLPAGTYLLQVQTADGTANFRFIKE